MPEISCSLFIIKKSSWEISANQSILLNNEDTEETFPYIRWEKKNRNKDLCSFLKGIQWQCYENFLGSSWPTFNMISFHCVYQNAPVWIIYSFYNPYLITHGSLKAGMAKHWDSGSPGYFPSYCLCNLGQCLLISQRLTFPICKMGTIIVTNP